MRFALSTLILPALLAAGTAAAQTQPAISIDTLRTVTEKLASDEFEGRAPATPGEDKTIAYLIERMQAAGLKPGNKGSWVQDVPMVEITAGDVSPFTFTGGKTPLSFAYRTDMVLGTHRVVPKVELKNSDVVFVGYGITTHVQIEAAADLAGAFGGAGALLLVGGTGRASLRF